MKTQALMIILLAAALPVWPQEVESEPSVEPLLATVSQDVNVHRAPAGATTGTLAGGTNVQVIGISSSGWVRVRHDGGKGWVDRRFLRPAGMPALSPRTFALEAKAKAGPCKNTLGACPARGCAEADSSHALFNMVKHGPPSGKLRKLPLALFAKLQDAADNVVGQAADLDAEDRKAIRSLQIGQGKLGEGQRVAITGFIVGNPHANNGESVNCRLTAEEDNDFHISIATGPNRSEFESIVVEMIPQDRPSGWTLAALRKAANKKRRIMAVGQLFYDNIHRVNKNPDHNLQGQPKRFSLWEVHPITEFFVCTTAPCDVNDKDQWTKLEDLQ